jgi:hypothetical protein
MIFTDMTVPMRPKSGITREYWIAQAQGVVDDYGNPFRTVKLRLLSSATNVGAEFEKTLGFEDAIISRGANNNLNIRYRPGSLTWNRPLGGIGEFEALVPVTTLNMRKLASCYPNKKWTIVEADIRDIVAKMWDEKWKIMQEDVKKFNTRWFKEMHMRQSEKGKPENLLRTDNTAEQLALETKEATLNKREQELNLEAAKLKDKEKELVDAQVVAVENGKQVFAYQEVSLRKMKLHELRAVCRKVGANFTQEMKFEELVSAVLMKQRGEVRQETSSLED